MQKQKVHKAMHNKAKTKIDPHNQWEAHQKQINNNRTTALERTAA